MPKGLRGFQKGNKLGKGVVRKWSAKTRAKMVLAIKNRPIQSAETRRKRSLAMMGIKKSPEHIAKMVKTKKQNRRYGENASNWKGGKTRLTQLIRSSFSYRQWRSDIFQRDGYCCMECGKKSNGDIESHHIKSLAKIIAERNIRSIEEAMNCEELWNINNGLTLCVECHKKTDTYCNTNNGKTKNSPR